VTAAETAEGSEDVRGRSRREQILAAAAGQFGAHGFHGANMRDVAAAAGVLVGSIYYHFPSKEALFVAVHGAAVDMMTGAVRGATLGIADPWDRLEAAAAAHCEMLNSDNSFVGVIAPSVPASLAHLRAQLTVQRDAYETLFSEMIANLSLEEEIDAKLFRLHLLAALNGTKFWYSPGGRTPADIGRQLVRMFRGPA